MTNCPICKKTLSYREWNDDQGLEEYVETCINPSCKGYIDSWAFGYSDFKIGKWQSGTFVNHRYITDKNSLRIANNKEKEFALRIRYFNRRK